MSESPSPSPGSPAKAAESPQRQAVQVAVTIVIVAALLNAAFYVLSSSYFADRAAAQNLAAADQAHAVGVARMAFAVFSAIVAAGAIGAVLAPRLVGFGLVGVAAAFAAYACIGTYKAGAHVVMPATLIVLAGLKVALLVSAARGGRAAWAFLIALTSTLAVVTLFGATKVRAGLGIGLWYAMIIPGMLTVATAALVMIRGAYAERAAR